MELINTVLLGLIALSMLVITIVIILGKRKIDQASEEISQTLALVKEHVVPTADEARKLIAKSDLILEDARRQLIRIDRIGRVLERITAGKTILNMAGKAAATSKVTLFSVLEGLRQGVRVLGKKQEVESDVRDT